MALLILEKYPSLSTILNLISYRLSTAADSMTSLSVHATTHLLSGTLPLAILARGEKLLGQSRSLPWVGGTQEHH